MRRIMAAAFVSVDGVMQAPGGPTEDPTGGFSHGGWTFHHWDEPLGKFMGEMFASPFDLLLGRKTYEIFAAHWPFVDSSDPVAASFNAATKYVVTSSTQPLLWTNSVAIGGDVAAGIARLKEQAGPNLLTQGSSVLLQTLLTHDLIDEFRLLTFPLVLGPGKRLFGQGTRSGALKLTSTAVSKTGVIMSVYQRAGAITTGSFMLDPPSEAEVARQARMKREG
jgi:dihydrofolate reductase